jgi:hypothetical protein
MNVAINNNFERIASPQLESGQYKVRQINGFTRALPVQKIAFTIIDPNPETNPGTSDFPTPGTNPEVVVTFYEPNPPVTPGTPGLPPGDPGSPGDPPIHRENNEGRVGRPEGPGWKQKTACFIGLVIVVDESGNITHSATSGSTTNNLDLVTLLKNSGKAPTTAGTYNFVFEFFGWRRDKNKLPPDDPNFHGGGWADGDDKYNIYNGSPDQFLT